MLSTLKMKNADSQKKPFHDVYFRDKVPLWHCNNESKNNISAPANKQLQSRPQTPKSQSASLFLFSRNFFYVAERVGKSRKYNFGTMKNQKKKVPGPDSDLMKLKSQQLQSVWRSEAFQDVTVAVKRDTWSLQRYLPLTITARMHISPS